MSGRQVHAVLAAAMADPSLLNSWRHGRDALSDFRIEELELEKMWRFCGLVTKVRHNDLRLELPLTFRLLDDFQLSIEAFAEYSIRAAALRRSGQNSKLAKCLTFTDFLEGWLDASSPPHLFIRDMVRHESAIMQLQTISSDSLVTQEQMNSQSVTLCSTPIHVMGFVFRELGCNPLAVGRTIYSGGDSLSVARSQQFWGYCKQATNASIDIVELDELTFKLLCVIDGSLTLPEIAAALSQSGTVYAAEDLCYPVQELVGLGLLATKNGV